MCTLSFNTKLKKDPYLSIFLHSCLGFRCLGEDTGEGDEGVNCDQTLRGQGLGTLECYQTLAVNELVE